MRLGTKLLLSFLSVAFLVLITGSLSYYLSNEIKNDLIAESASTSVQLQTLTEMTVQLQNSLLYTRNYLTEADKQRAGDESVSVAAQIRESERIAIESLDQFERALADLAVGDPDLVDQDDIMTKQSAVELLTDSLQQSFSYYNTLVRELYEIDQEVALGNEIFNVTIEPYFRNTLLQILLRLRSAYNDRVDAQLEHLQLRAEQTVSNIIFYSFLAFGIALLLAYLMHRSITRPVKELTQTARELGDGNLSKRIKLNTNDELANLADTFNKMAENLSKSMVSRSYVNNIIQSMGEMLIVTDSDGHIEIANKAVAGKLKTEPSRLEGEPFWSLIAGEEREIVKRSVEGTNRLNGPVETRFVSTSGDVIPVNLSYTRLENDGELSKRIYVASDISILKEAEQKISDSLKEKSVLLAEIHHRVKNNLAVISGLLEMQIWNIDDEERTKILKDSQLRIQSIALVHEKLYQTENFADVRISDYIKELVKGIAESFKDPSKKIDVYFSCEDISMNINQAIPFSLLLNEGVVNVYKHAFKGRSEGRFEISLKRDGDDLHLRIIDNGTGLVKELSEIEKPSLGMTLIDTLSKQLEGKYTLATREDGNGTLFELKFPAE
ncbi:MAG: HAMP domain-containing protein [Balneolaceae bacterium]|nr:HAMP domain-containing protein [Balneolaceae bacterium]MCH8549252.1 HAMP domain-containing protein [Balneolaceae bacterium]